MDLIFIFILLIVKICFSFIILFKCYLNSAQFVVFCMLHPGVPAYGQTGAMVESKLSMSKGIPDLCLSYVFKYQKVTKSPNRKFPYRQTKEICNQNGTFTHTGQDCCLLGLRDQPTFPGAWCYVVYWDKYGLGRAEGTWRLQEQQSHW